MTQLKTQRTHCANVSCRAGFYWLSFSILILLAITCAPIDSLLNLFHDDSFFYMVIARNHSAGFGYSFDSLNMTNGFHPLWLWILSGLVSFEGLIGDQGIRVVVALQTALSLSAALIYLSLLRTFKVPNGVQVLFFVAFVFLCTLADIGQESALYSFLVALIVWILLGKDIGDISGYLSVCLASSWLRLLVLLLLVVLVVLSRLDSVFLLGGLALSLLLVGRLQESVIVMLGIMLGLISTFAFNYLVFGHPYSISSWLKSGFDWNKALQLLIPGLLVRVGLVFLLLGGAIMRLKRGGVLAQWRDTLSKQSFISSLIVCVTLAYITYFTVLFLEVSALGSWYFNQALGLSVFLLALTFSDVIVSAKSRSSYAPFLVAFAFGATLFAMKWIWAHSSDATREIGLWISANINTNTVIFQRDGAGAVSYFAQRPIINGDGLVNNMQYQQMLRSGRLCDYLNQQKVQYVVTNSNIGPMGKIQDYIFLWTKGLASIPLTNVDPALALYVTHATPHYRVFSLNDAATVCNK